MAEEHVAEELVRRFLRGQVSPGEARGVTRHLLTGCTACTETAGQLTREIGPGAPGWEERHEEIFRRALAFDSAEEQRLALEKLRAWAQWVELEPVEPRVRLALVESDPRYHTRGLYDRLLDVVRGAQRAAPAQAVEVARLAALVAERLDPDQLGGQRVAGLLASAWAALGNAQRLASDFEGARQAFNEAWRILDQEGADDPRVQAEIICLEASYMNDIGEFETAEVALEEALEIYRRLGDAHLQGRVFLKMGDTIGHVEPERGLAHIRKGLSMIDTAREPRLELCAWHDCAWYLTDSGHFQEALAVLEQVRPLYQQFPDPATQLRLHWLEGRIAQRLGELGEAERIFQWLWEEIRSRDLHHELVLVSIDLAEVLVQKGEGRRAADLVQQCYPVLETWGLHRYALAAWLLFQRSVGLEQAGDLFRRMREYYRRSWNRPAVFS